MTCPIDLSKLPHGKRYLIPLATSTAAMVFMLVAAYSCKFVRVTRGNEDDLVLAPFFFGIWKAEGGIVAGQGYLDNTNQCIAWTDTSLYQDGGLRAAKFFTIVTTFGGTFVWILVWMGAFQKVVGHVMRSCLLVGCCVCAILNVMFFCVFASNVCDNQDLTCRMGAAAYLTLTATVLWMATAALSFAFTTTPKTTAASVHATDESAPRDLVSVVTSHSTPTVPTGTVPRTYPYKHHGAHRAPSPSMVTMMQTPTIKEIPTDESLMEQRYSGGSGGRDRTEGSSSNSGGGGGGSSSNNSSPNRPSDPWQDHQSTRTSSSSFQQRSTPVDLDEEVGIDDMPPIGSSRPLVSITEDDRGNLIRTTITRTVDSQGRTIIDRTSQIIEDKDKSETAEV